MSLPRLSLITPKVLNQISGSMRIKFSSCSVFWVIELGWACEWGCRPSLRRICTRIYNDDSYEPCMPGCLIRLWFELTLPAGSGCFSSFSSPAFGACAKWFPSTGRFTALLYLTCDRSLELGSGISFAICRYPLLCHTSPSFCGAVIRSFTLSSLPYGFTWFSFCGHSWPFSYRACSW